MHKSKYTIKLLGPIVKKSKSVSGVCKHLGLKLAGGNISHIKRMILYNGISMEHFLGQGINKNFTPLTKKTWREILKKTNKIQHGHRLRRALIESGRQYLCQLCDQKPNWNTKKLNLTVDHINGDNTDHRLKNLRFLCPNCHSQTETFAGRNKNTPI